LDELGWISGVPFDLSIHANLLEKFANILEDKRRRLFNEAWQVLKYELAIIPFVVRAEAIRFPSIRISTVAASTHSSFEPHFKPFVIRFFEALLTNYASWVFFTGLTFPCNITV
jgi:hypothetical protein